MLESLKQFFNYSREFRIAAPQKSDYPDSLERIASSLKALLSDAETGAATDDSLIQLTTEIGTTLWRLQRRLKAEGEAADIIRRSSRDLESISDSLSQSNIEIRDHTGEKYDDGMVLKVIAFQPVPGLHQQQVLETIKPTIYYKNTLIQTGQVIVGVPEKTKNQNVSG